MRLKSSLLLISVVGILLLCLLWFLMQWKRTELPTPPLPLNTGADSPLLSGDQVLTGASGAELPLSWAAFEAQYYQHLQEYFEGGEEGYEQMYGEYGRESE